jgi:hypothetical protein
MGPIGPTIREKWTMGQELHVKKFTKFFPGPVSGE